MIPAPFDYVRPGSLDEALSLLAVIGHMRQRESSGWIFEWSLVLF